MLLEEKLFNLYPINFPLKNELSIIIGSNGSGKTKLLEILNRHYQSKNTNVIYFSDQRRFEVKEDDFMNHYLMWKLTEQDNKNEFIYSGITQLVNFFGKILMAKKNTIVLIDEVERNLHIAIQHDLLNSLLTMSNIKKLIVTTHSPAIIGNWFNDDDPVFEMGKIYK